jgi:hypothetical protein
MGTSKKSQREEAELSVIAKRMLGTAPKPREDMKIGKTKRTAGKGRARVGKAKG